MASESVPANMNTAVSRRSAAQQDSVWQTIKRVLKPIASLRVAVVLFAMSAFLVLIGTLALDKQGMWEVVDGYFRAKVKPPQFGFVEVDATTFFPKKWFRDMYRDPVTKVETPELAHKAAGKWAGIGFMAFGLIAAFFYCMSAKSPRRQIIGASVAGGLGLYLGLFTLFKGGFYFPGGMLIGGALTINLLAAHTVRFTVKTKGMRLASGLAVIVVGIAVAVLITLNGHNQEGLRGEPPFSWEALWWVVQMGLIFACLACVGTTAMLANSYFKRQRRGSKTLAFLILSASLAVLLGGSVIYFQIFAPGYDISAIRVLWQLIQGFIAALILLAGCILAFKKRAGIVLLHAGVGLLMFNELFVGMHAIEEQMLIEEGKSANFSISDQELELAIVDTEDSEEDDKVVVVPLARNGGLTRLARNGAVIEDDSLPFKIKVVEFFRNSAIEDVEQGDKNPASNGIGKRLKLVRLPPAAGADSKSSVAGAYVKFMTKDGEKDLGTYMLSQRLSDIQRIILLQEEMRESVRVDGKTYHVSLRYKRDYKPYSIYLEDVQKNEYLGTATPRDFSSYIVFKDEERGINLNHRIWMNNPMRYAGWTYYQSGYETQAGTETTTLQMVKNRGWMIPYLACMTVVVGMAAHFVITLIRFLGRIVSPSPPQSAEKPRTNSPKSPKSPASAQPALRPANASITLNIPERNIPAWISCGLAALAVAAVIGSVAVFSIPPAPVAHEMNLYEFGKLPVVYRGRAKPMDSLARDSLRVLSKSSTFKDESDEKQPAIRWLLDHIANEELADKHQVFKITNLEVLGDLKLDRRPRFRYSFDEIGEDGVKHISEQAEKAHKMSRDGTLLTPVEEQFIDLEGKLRLYRAIREGFRLLDTDGTVDEEIGQALQMTRYAKTLMEQQVPLAVPTNEDNESVKQLWQPLAASYQRAWLHELGKKYKATTARELGKKLAAASAANTDGAFRKNFDEFAQDYVKELDEVSQMQLRRMAAEKNELFEKLITAVYEDRISQRISNTLKETGFESALTDAPNPVALSLKQVLAAYKEKDVDRFNDGIAACEEITQKTFDVDESDASKVGAEAVYNHAGWLHACFGFYILAFVLAALSWLAAPFGFFRPLNRAALAMVIATFAIHTVDLLGRIYISGRPPVTNLYSSAVFISWGFVLIGLIVEAIFRVGIGHVISSVFGTLTIAIAIFGLSSDLATGGDTMGVMQAVLDTQFWLATHVVCITLGYVTMFLAGCFGVTYIFVGLFSPLLKVKAFHDWTFGQVFSKIIYGITCFAVFFSFYGTVLGGLWADESWGRFWGWDPKENGALIIVLWSVLILHARWAGIIKDRGLAVLAVGGNIVTAWSWFGVNQLGIGLHAYGFTEVVMRILGWFVASQLLIICLGSIPLNLWWSFRDRGDDNPVRAELA